MENVWQWKTWKQKLLNEYWPIVLLLVLNKYSGKKSYNTCLILCPVCAEEDDYDNGLRIYGFCGFRYNISCVNILSKDCKKINTLKDSVKWITTVCTAKINAMMNQVGKAGDYINLHEMVGNLAKLVTKLLKTMLW